MKIRHAIHVPAVATFLYLGAAIYLGFHAEGGGLSALFLVWELLSWALLASSLLWGAYGLFWLRRPDRSATGLVLLAVVLPVMLWGANSAVRHYRAYHESLSLQAMRHARLVHLDDGALLTPSGNLIGVRLGYRVQYPARAIALLASHPWDPLFPNAYWMPPNLAFRRVSQRAELLAGGIYAITDDLVPDFMPGFLKRPGRSTDRCFAWPPGTANRAAVLETPAAPLHVWLSDSYHQAQTAHAYILRGFYEGALNEGARECGGR